MNNLPGHLTYCVRWVLEVEGGRGGGQAFPTNLPPKMGGTKNGMWSVGLIRSPHLYCHINSIHNCFPCKPTCWSLQRVALREVVVPSRQAQESGIATCARRQCLQWLDVRQTVTA